MVTLAGTWSRQSPRTDTASRRSNDEAQVVAITGSQAWLFLVENLTTAIDYRIGRWFPFQALNAIFITPEALTEPGALAPLAPSSAPRCSSPTSWPQRRSRES